MTLISDYILFSRNLHFLVAWAMQLNREQAATVEEVKFCYCKKDWIPFVGPLLSPSILRGIECSTYLGEMVLYHI